MTFSTGFPASPEPSRVARWEL